MAKASMKETKNHVILNADNGRMYNVTPDGNIIQKELDPSLTRQVQGLMNSLNRDERVL